MRVHLYWTAIATLLTSVAESFPTNNGRWIGPGPRRSSFDFNITVSAFSLVQNSR